MTENTNSFKELFETWQTLFQENNELKIYLKKLEIELNELAMKQLRMLGENRDIHEELRIAKAKAEESDHVKNALLSSLSHEFRTPMNGIMGFAELLRENLKDDNLLSMVNNILQSGNRLMSTLNSIQFLAELEGDTVQKDFQPLHINTFLLSSLGEFESKAYQKNIYIKTRFLDWRLVTNADTNLLRIATHHLLENALKFTENGGITIETGKTKHKGKEKAYISIIDTGIGILKEDIQKIFEPFRQISEGWGRIYEGTGLGLPICLKILAKLNGNLEVKSKAGEGSIFTIYLPLIEGHIINHNDTPWNSIHETMERDINLMSQEQIPVALIVEDNTVNKELMIVFLKKTCKTEYAHDGETAVKMASEKKYSCILMDINLGPGIDGLEATRRIRELPGYQYTPIIAVTGYTLTGDKERLLTGGCSHYLPKPFDRNSIVNLVEDVLYTDITN